MIDIKIDSDKLSNELSNLPNRLKQATEKGLDELAEFGLSEKKQSIQSSVYDKPIPTGKDGKPKYERSGDLLKDQTIKSTEGSRQIINSGSSAEYEIYLKDNFSEIAQSKLEQRAKEIVEEQIKKALNL